MVHNSMSTITRTVRTTRRGKVGGPIDAMIVPDPRRRVLEVVGADMGGIM